MTPRELRLRQRIDTLADSRDHYHQLYLKWSREAHRQRARAETWRTRALHKRAGESTPKPGKAKGHSA